MMTEPLAPEINFPQSVEEKESRLNDRVFEFLLNKFKRRKRAHFHEQSSLGTSLQQSTATI